MLKSGIFTLNWKSIADAAITAVIFAVLTAMVGVVTTAGFNVFAANWVMIGENMVNIGFIGLFVSLGQNLLSTNNGSVLGLTPGWPTTTS